MERIIVTVTAIILNGYWILGAGSGFKWVHPILYRIAVLHEYAIHLEMKSIDYAGYGKIKELLLANKISWWKFNVIIEEIWNFNWIGSFQPAVNSAGK